MTSDNLTQLALQYDYYDRTYFNRDFKEFMNLSPLQLFQKI
ncbi:AraC family transcriptional regulator [Capnocytophaga canis]